MKSRLKLPTVGELTAGQRLIYDDIIATRGNVEGPFLAWLHSPALAEPAQKLGAFCRYGTSLSLDETELLILLVAANFNCVGEQQIHEPIALRAGLTEDLVTAIRSQVRLKLPAGRLKLLSEVAHELLTTNKISETLYQRAESLLGHVALVETVGVMGYYTLVAMTLNAFDMRKE